MTDYGKEHDIQFLVNPTTEQQLFYNSLLSKFSSYKYRFDYDIHQDMSVETGNNNFFK